MPVPERSLRAGPIARVALALLVGAMVGYLGRAAQDRPAPTPVEPTPPAAVAAPAVSPEPSQPLPPPALTRADLLAAVAMAADARGAGADPPRPLADLVGRRFEIRLTIACAGEPAAAALAAETNATRKTLKLRARPETWSDAPWFKALAGDAVFDAAEGFWIPRPWTASAACPPPVAEGGGPAAVLAGAVGLVQLFEPDGSRAMRRGERPYEHTQRANEQESAPGAYRMLLAGRIAQFAEGQPVRCHATSPNQRPVCMIAVALDHVAFEDSQGASLADWRG